MAQDQGNQLKLDDASLDYLWNTFSNVNEWIRFSDAKAGGIIVANGTVGPVILLSDTIKNLTANNGVASVFVVVCAITLIFSTGFALHSLLPRIHTTKTKNQSNASRSVIFYGHIATDFKTAAQFEAGILKVLEDPMAARSQIIHQIWSNSDVATRKYRLVLSATRALYASIGSGLFLLAIIVYQVIQTPAK